jgi:hypothetical protein
MKHNADKSVGRIPQDTRGSERRSFSETSMLFGATKTNLLRSESDDTEVDVVRVVDVASAYLMSGSSRIKQ